MEYRAKKNELYNLSNELYNLSNAIVVVRWPWGPGCRLVGRSVGWLWAHRRRHPEAEGPEVPVRPLEEYELDPYP